MDWNPADTWDVMADFLRQMPASLEQRPDAIVLISGHWEEDVVTIQNNPAPPLLFDYYGFPQSTYQLTYGAPGSPALAKRIASLLADHGIASRFDADRGFDHGVFIPLKVALPDADIPIVQISLLKSLDPAAHIAIGAALAPLRNDNVLIAGSGMTYHNMRALSASAAGAPAPGSEEFDDWLMHAVTGASGDDRNASLTNWESAPLARAAHPREEHLLPLHVVVGAAGDDEGRRTLLDHVLGAAQSAYQFG